jgi:hypothetical protein
MKTQHVAGGAIAVILAVIAVEKWYVHPTFGRGVSALIAATQAAITLS